MKKKQAAVLKQILAERDQFLAGVAEGLETSSLDDEDIAAEVELNQFFISAWAYSPQAPAGETAHFRAHVTNAARSPLARLHVSLFFGAPGGIGVDDAYTARDPAWPSLSSEPFTVEPGESHTIDLGYIVPADAEKVRCFGRAILWSMSYPSEIPSEVLFHVTPR